MAITLADAKVGMADKVDQQIVDKLRRSSVLLDKMVFDNDVSPTGGSTLAYSFQQLKTARTAAKRTLNQEYTAGEAKRELKTVALNPYGASFEIDRVIANTSGAIDEVEFQFDQATKATKNMLHNALINAVKATDGFDGLKTLLADTDNEFTSAVAIDGEHIDDNAQAFLDEVQALVNSVEDGADALLMNTLMYNKLNGIARRAGYRTESEDAFGKQVVGFNGVPMIDMGKYFNGTATVDVIETTAATADAGAKTAIYAVKLGLDAFHMTSPEGNDIVKAYRPDFNQPGAVKKGEVEIVCAAVLKNTNKAAVLKDIVVSPKTGA